MAEVVIHRDERHILSAEVQKLSPLGFDCEIPFAQISELRDESGRIQTFGFELHLSNHVKAEISGNVSIYSIRRVTQNIGMLTARFVSLTAEQEKKLNEFIHTGKIVDIKAAQQKKRRA